MSQSAPATGYLKGRPPEQALDIEEELRQDHQGLDPAASSSGAANQKNIQYSL